MTFSHKRWRIAIEMLLALALVAAACGDDGGPAATPAPTAALPGEGVSVSMARANWDTGYFQAAVYKALLEELGYTVSDPSQAELAPGTFYPALADREYDFWVNGWFPIHDTLLAAEHPAGGTLGDRAQKVGEEMLAGGLQGFIVDKATAEAHGITQLDDIGNDPAIAALFDTDGDGLADLAGCNDGWGCQVVIDTYIADNGWSMKQVSAEYAVLFADVVGRYNRGEPILAYTWTPSAYITELVPGDDVIWISVANPQPDQVGAVALPESQCPDQPCEMGFVAADIHVVANNEFLSENPAALKLFKAVQISVIDVALQNVVMGAGEDTQPDIDRHAAEWIANNRSNVDVWIAAALAAA